jgi:5-methylcytosine-specific restriction endonuclease McrA
MNKKLIEQLKKKEAKRQLYWKTKPMSNNDVAKFVFKSTDTFLYSQEWKSIRKQAIELYGTTCVKCGAEQTKFKKVNIDHIKPRKYFPHLALDISNLQPLCPPCNKRKGNAIY